MRLNQRQHEQQTELESLTVRIPRLLKERLGSLLGGNASENARVVLETGMRGVDSLQDKHELIGLQKDERSAMLRILAKGYGEPYSRAEAAFLAQRAHQSYQLADTGIVNRNLLLSNLKAFDAVRRLRIECISQGMLPLEYEAQGLDRYYHGNLGNSNNESLNDTVAKCIAELSEFPYRSHAEFYSRCLEVALRDEPVLPLDRLNIILSPYIKDLILVALRSFSVSTQQRIVEPKTIYNGGTVQYLQSFKLGSVSITPTSIGDEFTAGIIFPDRDVIVALNSFIEFRQFDVLARAFQHAEWETKGGKYLFLKMSSSVGACYLRVGGVQMGLSATEYADLLGALDMFKADSQIKSELERLSNVFGEI